jgi:hypothetical protein
MPVKAGTIDPSVVDISKLYLCPVRNVHLRSWSHLDGELRIGDHLYSRRRRCAALSGYPIEQIAEHGDFLETRKLPGFRAMTKTPKTGYARLAGPDIFGIAMRGKLSAIGRVNPPQPMFRGGEASGEGCFALPAIILLSIS